MSGPIRRGPAIYHQIMDDLKRQISDGTHPENSRLPSENELAAAYFTSRTTISKALGLLRQAGWVDSRHGQGHFVAPAGRRRTALDGTPAASATLVAVNDADMDIEDAAHALFWWTVPAVVAYVHDGDTVTADLDLGWHLTMHASVRVAHINAPELATQAGMDAAAFARTLLPAGAPVMVTSERLDKYGRTLAVITMHTLYQAPDGRTTADFGTAMLWAGHATPYEGR